MNIYKEKTIASPFPIAAYQAKDILNTFAFLLAAIIAPALLAHSPQNQWITGTIVNAILFLAVWQVGFTNASLVAALPSSIALLRGLLPAPIASMIPYIIVSNVILISVFFVLKKHTLPGIIFASAAKFFFLYATTLSIVKISGPLAQMMHWPQLATSLAGGLIAFGAIKYFQKN